MTRSTKSAQSTLLNRACNLPSTADEKSKEVKHVSDVLKANGYPQSIISNILKKERAMETILSQEELVGMFFNVGCAIRDKFWLGLSTLYQWPHRTTSKKIEFELSPDPTQPYNRNSLRQNSGRPATFKQIWSTNLINLIYFVLVRPVLPSRAFTRHCTYKTFRIWLTKIKLSFLTASTCNVVICWLIASLVRRAHSLDLPLLFIHLSWLSKMGIYSQVPKLVIIAEDILR